ncbi:hypothetical protein PHET_05159 [Paragonimus heterotremus]|uniref:Ion transport domain-containing protein n=1 Tax=Paragonimus heterotremus TaxID=100268 RepID=A0A8J4T007_9TREM|nr:hypothetical protein PHET_05159 [Paragonimus heterotremus]
MTFSKNYLLVYVECTPGILRIADVNLKTKDGLTPLHCAAKYRPIKLTEQVPYKKSIPLIKLVDCIESPSEGSKQPVVDPVIDYLYECGSNLEEKDTNGMTALHYAAARNNVLAARQLIQIGAYLECLDNEQMTPLLLAVRENHEETVKLLLEFGANSLFTDRRNCNILHHACHDGDSHIFQTVVEHLTKKHGKSNTVHMLNSFNKKKETPLHWAILSKSVDVTEMCIDQGADLNLRTANGESALHLAARSGELKIAEILLNCGSDVNAVDLEQRTPLFNAAENEHFQVASLLIKSGANINHVDKENMTPLLLAAGLGKCAVCELLIGNDVSVNVEDKQWKTPLMLAVEGKHLPVVQYLLQQGANIMVKNSQEHTPLHVAAIYGRFGIAQKLIEQTPIVAYERDEDGNYAVHLAAKHGFPQVLQKLIEHAGQTHERNRFGWTPLTFSASFNKLDCVKLLLDEGAQVNTKDKSNITPLFLACRGGHLDVVNKLLDAGADPGVRVSPDHEQYAGWNALDMAVDARKMMCVQAILKSRAWMSGLRNETYENPKYVNSPLRKMITDMPDAAQLALSQCVVRSSAPKHSPDYAITFNFEFLDDWDTSYIWRRKIKKYAPMTDSVKSPLLEKRDNTIDTLKLREFNFAGPTVSTILEDETEYGQAGARRRVHPVKLMLEHDRDELLNHPLVIALLALKWSRLCLFYYCHLAIYAFFLALFTAFMLQTKPPYMLYTGKEFHTQEICELMQNASTKAYTLSIGVPKYGVMILAIVNLLLEKWQWGTGTIGVFLAWMYLLLFVRKGPLFGIFVIMFVVVMETFVKFLVVFSPFLFAFALSFHALLANQIAFRDVRNSVIKTFAMGIGELDTSATLFERFTDSEMEKEVYYEGITYVLFVVFISLVSIVMMNLLVGLAVDDIKGVQRKAAFIRQEMKINLIFSMELLLSRFGQNLGISNRYIYKPHKLEGFYDRMFHRLYEQSKHAVQEMSELQVEEDEDSCEAVKKSPEKRLEEVQLQLAQMARLLNRLADTVNAGVIMPSGMSRKFSATNVARKARSRSNVVGTIVRSVHAEAGNDTDESQVGRDAKVFSISGPQMMSAFSHAPVPLPRLAVDEDLDEEPIRFG